MRLFSHHARVPASRLFFAFSSVLLVLSVLPRPVRAQQKTASAPPVCVPADVAALIVSEGHSVRVNPVKEESGRQGSRSSAMALGTSADFGLKEANNIFLKEARQGNPAAQVNLAIASLAGWGTQPNAGVALYWLHAAADRGYVPAFYDLGILYFNGCGVRRDFGEAFGFFEKGALGGDTAAEVNLGYFYDHGIGVPLDHAAAASWYRKAAESGEPQAQYNLADLYLHGEGVPFDEATAFAWFQKAAQQGHTGARIMLGSMLAAGRGAPKDLFAAYRWISAAALQGDTRGNATLLALERQLNPAQLKQAKTEAQSLAQATNPLPELALLHQR
jgi:TPR repeat protein